jgi:hypothetical protein
MKDRLAFEDLLSPFSIDVFMEKYWEKRSLLIPGSPAKLAGLPSFDRSALYSAMRSSPSSLKFDKAQYFDKSGVHTEFALPPGGGEIAPFLIGAGLTLCVGSMVDRSDDVRAVGDAIVRAFRWSDGRATAAAYASNDEGGFGLHFDTKPVLVLQCEGRKRWRYAETPAVRAPPTGAVADSVLRFARREPSLRVHVPDQETLSECVLHPGDILFLPGGTWHRTFADGFSLGLTFDFGYLPFLNLVIKALQGSDLARTPAWRTAVPESDDEARAFVRARLMELKQIVAELDVEALARVAVESQAEAARRIETTKSEPSTVGPTDRLRVLPRSALAFYTKTHAGEDLVGCAAKDSDGFEIPLTFAPLLERIVDAHEFVAGDVVGWCVSGGSDWSEVKDLLQVMCDTGAAFKMETPPS